jgi:hypothetical protein
LITLPFPGETKPVTLALATAVQAKVVPATFLGPEVILTVAVWPLQIVTLEAVAEGSGLTVTTKSIGKPMHPLKVGQIRYETVPDTLPVFTGASVIDPVPVIVTLAGLMVPLIVAFHE